MEVLRVVAEGLTTSFRYPHFLVGRQLSYHMPPPATIYGHVCSALGHYVNPDKLRFAYTFRYAGIADDLELLYLAEVSQKRASRTAVARNIEATTNPIPREVLLFPELTLYLAFEDGLNELENAFREPRYAVILGRSQDLMAYRSVERVNLDETSAVYYENTLLPWSFRSRTPAGVGVIMPLFIEPDDRRRVRWGQFLTLETRLQLAEGGEAGSMTVLQRGGDNAVSWADPLAPEFRNRKRAVVWHDFGGKDPDGSDFVIAN